MIMSRSTILLLLGINALSIDALPWGWPTSLYPQFQGATDVVRRTFSNRWVQGGIGLAGATGLLAYTMPNVVKPMLNNCWMQRCIGLAGAGAVLYKMHALSEENKKLKAEQTRRVNAKSLETSSPTNPRAVPQQRTIAPEQGDEVDRKYQNAFSFPTPVVVEIPKELLNNLMYSIASLVPTVPGCFALNTRMKHQPCVVYEYDAYRHKFERLQLSGIVGRSITNGKLGLVTEADKRSLYSLNPQQEICAKRVKLISARQLIDPNSGVMFDVGYSDQFFTHQDKSSNETYYTCPLSFVKLSNQFTAMAGSGSNYLVIHKGNPGDENPSEYDAHNRRTPMHLPQYHSLIRNGVVSLYNDRFVAASNVCKHITNYQTPETFSGHVYQQNQQSKGQGPWAIEEHTYHIFMYDVSSHDSNKWSGNKEPIITGGGDILAIALLSDGKTLAAIIQDIDRTYHLQLFSVNNPQNKAPRRFKLPHKVSDEIDPMLLALENGALVCVLDVGRSFLLFRNLCHDETSMK